MTKFKFKPFQREDYARAALHDGCILAHATGLGKSWGGVVWPLLKVGHRPDGLYPLKPVLLVIPEGLHNQMLREMERVFGITKVTLLDHQDKYMRMTANNTQPLEPGWYLTSYTQLTQNGVKLPPMVKEVTPELMAYYQIKPEAVRAYPMRIKLGEYDNREATFEEKAFHLMSRQRDLWMDGVGMSQNDFSDSKPNPIRCIWAPSLADLCYDAFEAVVIDEGVKMKGTDTIVGKGIRLMNPKYRLVMTATPIKNRLPDLFWLAWWACGGKQEAHPRWPYSASEDELERFSAKFLVGERNLSKERRENQGRTRPKKQRNGQWRKGKVTAEVCNIHLLWKLIAPVVVRRQKQNIGEAIVAKVRKPVRVPMGTHQARTYHYHLNAPYLDKNLQPALGAKLQALREVAADPGSTNLVQQSGQGPVQYEIEGRDGEKVLVLEEIRSAHRYTPKMAACLKLIADIVSRGEQVVVFGAFYEVVDTVAFFLKQSGVPFEVVDGRTSPAIRGRMSSEFQRGRPHANPVMLANIMSMSEGHNWYLCNNVILIAYDWAYDKFEQGINRCHRLPSPKDVNVYPIICEGTIDRRLESLIEEKGNSAELVLDGKLLGETVEEVNLVELLRIAQREFKEQDTVDEEELEKEWPALCDSLRYSWMRTRHWGVNGGVRRVPPESLVLPKNFFVDLPIVKLSKPLVRRALTEDELGKMVALAGQRVYSGQNDFFV